MTLKDNYFLKRAFVIFLFLISLPSLAQEGYKTGPQPGWLTAIPADDEGFMYFVGTGENQEGRLSEAEKVAVADIVSQILKFVGVTVSAMTTSEARGSLDEFKSSLIRQVSETGGARLSGFRVKEKWLRQNGKRIFVAILVSYERQALLEEKERLAKLFASYIDSVRIPEEEGDRFVSEGRLFKAALSYLKAAVAAFESSLEGREIALSRNLAKAQAILEGINLTKLTDNLTAKVGYDFEKQFSLRLTASSTPNNLAVSEIAVRVTYYEANSRGDLVPKSQTLLSDQTGVVSFQHPKPNFVGQGRLLMALDLAAQLEGLFKVEQAYPEKIALLKGLLARKQVEFTFTVYPAKALVPYFVFVVDLDEKHEPLAAYQSTASGINEVLSQNGFELKSLNLVPGLLKTKTESELLALAKATGLREGRLILGQAYVDSVSQDSGRFLVRVNATVKVFDLVSERLLYEKTILKSSTGTNLASALYAAFKAAGIELGKRLAAEIRE